MKIIKAQIQLMSAMIRQLLDFGRRGRAHKQAVDLRELAKRTVQLLDPLAKRQNITLELRPGDLEVLAEIDGPQIQQVLSNIIENALHAMPKGGIVTVRVEAGPFRPAGRCTHAWKRVYTHRRRGSGDRDSAGELGAHFRSILHHQGSWKGNGSGTLDRSRDRPRSRRMD